MLSCGIIRNDATGESEIRECKVEPEGVFVFTVALIILKELLLILH